MSESRSEFEAWWDELLPGSNYTRAENYDCSASEAITIWQASRRAALKEAAKVCEAIADGHDFTGNTQAAHAADDCVDAIRELAGKTKEGQEPCS